MAEEVLSGGGDAAGTPRKRSRDAPGSGSEFQTPVTKRLRAAPGSQNAPNSPGNSQNSPGNSQNSPGNSPRKSPNSPRKSPNSPRNSPNSPQNSPRNSPRNSPQNSPRNSPQNSPRNSRNPPSSEENQQKGILPPRLEIPQNSQLPVAAFPEKNPGISQNSPVAVGAFYGRRIYLDPLERKRLRELLGDGKAPGEIGNSGNSGKNLGKSGKKLGNSGRNPGNSGRNCGNSTKKFGNSRKKPGNSGKNLGNSAKKPGNSGRNLGDSRKNSGNFGGNCGGNWGSKGKAHPKDPQEIPRGNFGNSEISNSRNSGLGDCGNNVSVGNSGNAEVGNLGDNVNLGNSGNFGNFGNGESRGGFRVLRAGVRPPLRLPRGSSFFLSGKKTRKNSQKNPGSDGKNPPETAGKENRECPEGIPRKNPPEKPSGEERIPRKNPPEKSRKENRECSEGEEEIPRENPLEQSEIPRKNPLENSGKGNWECPEGKEEIPRENPLEQSEIPRKNTGNAPGKEGSAGIPHSRDSLGHRGSSGSPCPAGLFPIFLPGRRRPLQELPAPLGPSGKAPTKSKEIPNSRDQLIIDVGQRALGPGQCPSCGMVFAPGIPEDRLQHLRHHRRLREGLRYPGWKQQRVVAEFWDGKIVLILPGDPKYALRKAQEVLEVVDSELGFPGSWPGSFPASSRLYLFVGTGRCVLGCLLAHGIQQAFRVLPDAEPSPVPENPGNVPRNAPGDAVSPAARSGRAWRCSARPEGAVCGVSRLWVPAPRRRRGIARRMADALRQTFVFGSVLAPGDLAFSDPTGDGRAFAERYCGRPDFLVYSLLGNAPPAAPALGSPAPGSS